MQHADHLSIMQMAEFLQGSLRMEFSIEFGRGLRLLSEWVLSPCQYSQLGKRERGVVLAYPIKLRPQPGRSPLG